MGVEDTCFMYAYNSQNWGVYHPVNYCMLSVVCHDNFDLSDIPPSKM